MGDLFILDKIISDDLLVLKIAVADIVDNVSLILLIELVVF